MSNVKRKCSECGMLGLRSGGDLVEAHEAVRESGENLIASRVFCSAVAADLPKEFDMSRGDLTHPLKVIRQPRDCDRFCDWHPGLSPKEHKMLVFDKQAELERKLHEQKQSAIDRMVAVLSAFGGVILGSLLTWLVTSRGPTEIVVKSLPEVNVTVPK